MAFGGGAAETARMVAELDLHNNMSAGINSALGSITRLQGGLGRMARGTGQVASGLDRLGTRAAIAAAGGLAAVVKTSASFEQAFTGIEKTVDATAPQFARLNEQFREMARTIPVSFEELANIGAAGGALGIARQDLLDFTDVVARLSVSTNLSSDQAATALGQLGNVLHLRGQDFRDFADSLVALGNAGASTEDQIVAIAARFGAAGNAAGLSKEEILALSSAVASMGIQVEAGGSALSRIFNAVATNIGTSSSKAQAFADTLGLSARQFRDAWQKDALGTFQEFLGQLNKLDQFQAAALLKKIGITNTRDVSTVRLMGQNVGFVADQLKIADTAQGALNKESDKFFNTAQGQWKTLVNIFRDSAATIGDQVLPVTKDLIKQLSTFLNTPEMRANLKRFGQDLARGITTVVDTLKGADFSGLINGMKTAGQIASTAFNLFRSLPPEIQALAVSAIALNKVSGGAVGSIAKGLGNIFLGGLQTALGGKGGLLGGALGVLGGRGSSPAFPVFVSIAGGIPGLPGGGPMGGVPAGGLANLLPIIAGGAVVGLFVAGADFAFSPERSPLISRPGGHLGPGDLPGNQPTAGPRSRGGSFDVRVTNPDEVGGKAFLEAKSARLAQAAAFRNMTLELRLIKDKSFKPKLDAKEFISVLKRTSEFGAKGVGTGIEQGPKTGRDPFGQSFVALVKRLEPAALHTPIVLGEIRRHIIAAKEAQVAAVKDGDKHAARLLGQTIEQLRHILRSDDVGNRKQDATKRAIDSMHARTVAHMQSILNAENQVSGNTAAIARKDFSPNINVNVPVTTILSVNDVIRQIVHTRTAIGTGPGGPAPLIGPGS